MISADLQTGKLDIKWDEKQENLYQWYVELNHADKKKGTIQNYIRK